MSTLVNMAQQQHNKLASSPSISVRDALSASAVLGELLDHTRIGAIEFIIMLNFEEPLRAILTFIHLNNLISSLLLSLDHVTRLSLFCNQ